MSEIIGSVPAADVGLTLEVSPLLGNAYEFKISGYVQNLLDEETDFILFWKQFQSWRAIVQPSTGFYINYNARAVQPPEISDFRLETRKVPRMKDRDSSLPIELTIAQRDAVGQVMADNFGANFQTGVADSPDTVYVSWKRGPNYPVRFAWIDAKGTVNYNPPDPLLYDEEADDDD